MDQRNFLKDLKKIWFFTEQTYFSDKILKN